MSGIDDILDISESENEEMEIQATEMESQKTPPFTSLEKNYLLELINNKKHILECKKTDFGSISKKKQEWKKVALAFNSELEFVNRTGDQLKNWWNNSKRIAKRKVCLHKRTIKKTGGGKNKPILSPNIEKIVSIVPQQMKSLENQYDCDGEIDISDEGTTGKETDKTSKGNEITNLNAAQKTPEKEKRKYKDARSSMVDMEHEEHKIRLKILVTELETAQIKKRYEERKLEILEIEHQKKYPNNDSNN